MALRTIISILQSLSFATSTVVRASRSLPLLAFLLNPTTNRSKQSFVAAARKPLTDPLAPNVLPSQAPRQTSLYLPLALATTDTAAAAAAAAFLSNHSIQFGQGRNSDNQKSRDPPTQHTSISSSIIVMIGKCNIKEGRRVCLPTPRVARLIYPTAS